MISPTPHRMLFVFDNDVFKIFLVDGGYSPFGNWSVCSATCGGGNMTRTRSCNSPVPAMGGKDCSQFGAPVEVMKCNEQQCPSKHLMKMWFAFPTNVSQASPGQE